MNGHHDCYVSNSGQYVDYLTFTSSSAIEMPTSSAIPQPAQAALPILKVELQPLVKEERPAGDLSVRKPK
jgi:hypothetical protein